MKRLESPMAERVRMRMAACSQERAASVAAAGALSAAVEVRMQFLERRSDALEGRLEGRVSQLEESSLATAQQLARLREAGTAGSDSWKKELDTARDEFRGKLRDQMEALQTRTDELGRTCRELAAKHERHSEDLAGLRALQGRLASLDQRHAVLESRSGALQEDNARRGQQLSARLEHAQEHLTQDLALCRAETKRQLEILGEQLSAQRGRLDDVLPRLEHLSEESRLLKQSLGQIREDVATVETAARKALEAACANSDAQMRQLSEDAKVAHKSHAATCSRLDGLESMLDAVCSRQTVLEELSVSHRLELTKRVDVLSSSVEQARSSLGHEITRCAGEVNRQVGSLSSQLQGQEGRLDHMAKLAEKLPEVIAQQGALNARLKDISLTRSELEKQLASSKARIERHLTDQAQQAAQQLGEELAALTRNSASVEEEVRTQLKAALASAEEESERAGRSCRALGKVLSECQACLSRLRQREELLEWWNGRRGRPEEEEHCELCDPNLCRRLMATRRP
mmetsp:Transcript_4459/g.10344  ORF Transcript_4459/g.10344 Transcript_4459/m.10344 type:complete len:516 (-) Transcript_4459:8-1555(-)